MDFGVRYATSGGVGTTLMLFAVSWDTKRRRVFERLRGSGRVDITTFGCHTLHVRATR